LRYNADSSNVSGKLSEVHDGASVDDYAVSCLHSLEFGDCSDLQFCGISWSECLDQAGEAMRQLEPPVRLRVTDR
jgi:hypothetical protein